MSLMEGLLTATVVLLVGWLVLLMAATRELLRLRRTLMTVCEALADHSQRFTDRKTVWCTLCEAHAMIGDERMVRAHLSKVHQTSDDALVRSILENTRGPGTRIAKVASRRRKPKQPSVKGRKGREPKMRRAHIRRNDELEKEAPIPKEQRKRTKALVDVPEGDLTGKTQERVHTVPGSRIRRGPTKSNRRP